MVPGTNGFYDGEEGDFGPGTTFAKNFGLNLATGGIGGKTKLFGKALGKAGSFALRNSIEVGIETAFDVGYRGRDFGDSLLMNGIGSVGGELLIKGLMNKFKGGRKEYSYTGKLCFIAGTKVKTEDGYKNNEDIKIGDLVWSKDDSGQNNREAYKPVKSLFTTKPQQLVHLTYKARDSISSDDDEDSQSYTLTGTPNHPFWSVDRQDWVEMDDLNAGEQLLLSNHLTAYVESKTIENSKPGEHFTTYNFEVEEFHTYFVAPKNSPPSSFVWVHNKGKLCADGKAAVTKLINQGYHPKIAISMVRGTPLSVPVKFKNGNTYALLADKRGGNYRSWQKKSTPSLSRANNQVTGETGETMAEAFLVKNDWEIQLAIKNGSDNGIDIVAIGPNKQLGFFEVKTTRNGTVPNLSELQQGPTYIIDILNEARKGRLRNQVILPKVANKADFLLDLIESGTPVTKGIIGINLRTNKLRISPW